MGKGNRNSQKRELERQQNADKLLAMQKSKSKKSTKDKVLAIVISLIALLIVAMLVLGALSNAGFFIRNQSAVEGTEITVDAAMLSFLFNDHIINWFNEYGAYVSYGMFSIDPNKDLREQTYGDTKANKNGMAYEVQMFGSYNGTWYDYFMDTVKDEVEMYVVYAEAANKVTEKDLSLDAEDKKAIEDTLTNIRKNLSAFGASYSDWYGDGVKESDARRCYELIYLAYNFAEYYQEKLESEIKEDEIVDYRENNKELFYTADCLTYTISKSEKGMTQQQFDEAKAAAKVAADAIAQAKSPAEFIELVEKYEASLKETGTTKPTVSTETESDTETNTKTNTETNTDTDTETTTDTNTDTETGTVDTVKNSAANATESETDTETETEVESEADTESGDETEADLSAKLDKYKDTFEYATGTGTSASDKLNDFLFGNVEEETGSDSDTETGRGPAELGDVTVIEEEGTVTEKITTAKPEADKKEDNKKSVETETTESDSDTDTDTETGTEAETDKKPSNVKVYETYKVTVYFVIDPMHYDRELTHNFAYLVSDNSDQVLDFIADFIKTSSKSDDGMTLDLFVEVAEKQYKAIHEDKNHVHKDDEMFEFNKLEKQAAGAFGESYKVLNEWVESADRKDGDLTPKAVEIIITNTNSATNKVETTKQYGALFFDSHDEETWHVSATAGAVSQKFEEWYDAKLESADAPKINESVIRGIDSQIQMYLAYISSYSN